MKRAYFAKCVRDERKKKKEGKKSFHFSTSLFKKNCWFRCLHWVNIFTTELNQEVFTQSKDFSFFWMVSFPADFGRSEWAETKLSSNNKENAVLGFSRIYFYFYVITSLFNCSRIYLFIYFYYYLTDEHGHFVWPLVPGSYTIESRSL